MFRLGVLIAVVTMLGASASAEILVGLAPSLTGPQASAGEQDRHDIEYALADLNAKGGVLGQRLKTVLVDDQCDADAAVLAAKKLVAERVSVVFGHTCSGAAIPASEVYEAAGIPMFSLSAVSPKLTERGLHYVFRLGGRSDREAALVVELLAARFADQPIAVVRDTQVASVGLAADVEGGLHRHGLREVLDEQLEPGQVEFADLVPRLRQARVAVLFCACFTPKAGLLVRQVWESGLRLQAITGNAGGDSFWSLAGAEAASGTLLVQLPDWSRANIPEAAPLIARLKGDGIEPAGFNYQEVAGLQAWAQAVERAKSPRGADVAPLLQGGRFDTVLGTIGFDDKGDIVGPVGWVWNRWRDGAYVEVLTQPLLQGEIVEK